MNVVHYGNAQLHTADAIAVALVDCAEALARRARFAVVEIPTSTIDGNGTARLLIGPGIPVVCVSVEGAFRQGADADLAQLDVHRAVRMLRDTASDAHVPADSSALALDGGMLDEFWEYMRGDDPAESPDGSPPIGGD